MSEVAEAVMKIIAEQLGIPVLELKPENFLREDLNADELHMVELVMNFEAEFEIEIPDEEFDKLTTVKSMVDYILDSVEE